MGWWVVAPEPVGKCSFGHATGTSRIHRPHRQHLHLAVVVFHRHRKHLHTETRHSHRTSPTASANTRSQMRDVESSRQQAKLWHRLTPQNHSENGPFSAASAILFFFGRNSCPAAAVNSSICPRRWMRGDIVAGDADHTISGPLHQTHGPPHRCQGHAAAAGRCHEQHRHDDVGANGEQSAGTMAMPMMRMVGTMAPTPIGAGNDISAPNTHPPPRGMTLPAPAHRFTCCRIVHTARRLRARLSLALLGRV